MIHFRSVSDFQDEIWRKLHLVPHDIDVVVGIPRSGLLPATLISVAMNLPLADVEGFARGRLLAAGRTKQHPGLNKGASDLNRILLVDDSIQSGQAMKAARQYLLDARPEVRITTLAVYGVEYDSLGADIVLASVGQPRVFQWNVMHHKVLTEACVDIDGILCADPSDEQNDDGPRYISFLRDAPPLHVPTRRIHALVTSRLEKYRSETVRWLDRWGICYDHLEMLDLPDAQSRRESGAHGSFKGKYFRNSSAKLFIESELSQSHEIAVLSKKPVLWLPGAKMIYHDGEAPRDPLALQRHTGRAKVLARKALGEDGYARLKRLLGRRSSKRTSA